MKKLILTASLITLAMSNAFAVEAGDQDTQAKTKIERFSATTGAVIIRGFSDIGVVKGEYNTSIGVEAKEFTNAASGKKEYGITVQAVHIDGRYPKKHTSFIDFDEIEGLIKGIDYISNIKADSTKLANFQGDYSTRGDLTISIFNDSEGNITASVSSGKIGAVTAFFPMEKLSEIRSTIVAAQAKLNSIK